MFELIQLPYAMEGLEVVVSVRTLLYYQSASVQSGLNFLLTDRLLLSIYLQASGIPSVRWNRAA